MQSKYAVGSQAIIVCLLCSSSEGGVVVLCSIGVVVKGGLREGVTEVEVDSVPG